MDEQSSEEQIGLTRFRRRTAGDYVRGALAFLALVALIVGVPGALAWQIGWPLPHSWPSFAQLRESLTAEVAVKVLAVVVWLAWAQFTLSTFIEVKSVVYGRFPRPRWLPGRLGQLLAQPLVAALMSAVVGSAFGFAPSGIQVPMGLSHSTLASEQEVFKRRFGIDLEGVGEGPTKYLLIQPPEGRQHDSLREIAERHLGDGRRFRQIYELNKHRLMPDGSRLSWASLIRPGWILVMPADATGGEQVFAPDETPQAPDAAARKAALYSALLLAGDRPDMVPAAHELRAGLDRLFRTLGPPPDDNDELQPHGRDGNGGAR